MAEDPNYAATLQDFRQVLNNWQAETNDVKPGSLTADKYDRETGLGISVARVVDRGKWRSAEEAEAIRVHALDLPVGACSHARDLPHEKTA